jgi:hypothetical protein
MAQYPTQKRDRIRNEEIIAQRILQRLEYLLKYLGIWQIFGICVRTHVLYALKQM